MPVLTFDSTPKKFILPSTADRAEQAWVEMMTYPLCADDYATYYSKLYNLVEGDNPPVLNVEIVARRVTSWNYTDASGAPLPINGDTVGHLKNSDVSFLMLKIEDEPVEELDETLKGTSSATSSPSTPASP